MIYIIIIMILEIDQVVNNVERCIDSSLNYGRNVNDIIEWWLYSLIFKRRTEKEFTWNTLTIKLPVLLCIPNLLEILCAFILALDCFSKILISSTSTFLCHQYPSCLRCLLFFFNKYILKITFRISLCQWARENRWGTITR